MENISLNEYGNMVSNGLLTLFQIERMYCSPCQSFLFIISKKGNMFLIGYYFEKIQTLSEEFIDQFNIDKITIVHMMALEGCMHRLYDRVVDSVFWRAFRSGYFCLEINSSLYSKIYPHPIKITFEKNDLVCVWNSLLKK